MNWVLWQDIMAGRRRGVAGALGRGLLGLLEPGYRGTIAVRNRLFDSGFRRPRTLPGVTLSVGNLTAGGTGKTPMVAELARRLVALGARPAILMRGYMPDGSALSDEAAEYAAALGELAGVVPVVADPNRSVAAARALDEQPSVNVFILDDGFQHRQVHRDVDLVLIDGSEPFGYGHCLPRGLLREPALNLARAHAVIVTRADQCSDLPALDRRIQAMHGSPPLAHTAHGWIGWLRDEVARPLPLSALASTPVAAACGIGNPQAFFATLSRQTSAVVHQQAFPDHHAYRPTEVEDLMRLAATRGAQAVVVTEKDWVKWRRLLAQRPDLASLPVFRPVLRLRWIDGQDALDDLLRQVARAPHQATGQGSS